MITTEAIEAVAKLMCEELGVNPLDQVELLSLDTFAPQEMTWLPPIVTPRVHDPGVAPKYYVATSEYEAPWRPPTTYGERWRGYRRAAATALAGWKATHKYFLTA